MSQLIRSVTWRCEDPASWEHFSLLRTEEGWRLMGGVRLGGEPQAKPAGTVDIDYAYQVHCSPGWRTQQVRISCRGKPALELLLDPGLNWSRAGEALPALKGCLDVDLSISPSTNTLPIRRLELPVGASAEVTAAWVRFPPPDDTGAQEQPLEVQPLPQRYTRIDERIYRYESLDSGFVTELEVDDLGLVIRYPGAWERVE